MLTVKFSSAGKVPNIDGVTMKLKAKPHDKIKHWIFESLLSRYSCCILFMHKCTSMLPTHTTHAHLDLQLQLHTDQKIASF